MSGIGLLAVVNGAGGETGPGLAWAWTFCARRLRILLHLSIARARAPAPPKCSTTRARRCRTSYCDPTAFSNSAFKNLLREIPLANRDDGHLASLPPVALRPAMRRTRSRHHWIRKIHLPWRPVRYGIECVFVTHHEDFVTDRSIKILGMKLAPMPSTLCLPGGPPPRMDPWVSTATVSTCGSFFFIYRATPVKVPAVPEPMTIASILPSICSKISSAVVWKW